MSLGVLKTGLLSCSLLKVRFAPDCDWNANITGGPSRPNGGQLVGPFNRATRLCIKDDAKREADIAQSNVVQRLLGAPE